MTTLARLQRENEELRRRLAEAESGALERLREIEDLYRNAPVGLCQLDRDLRFVRINDSLAEINGIPPAGHIGRRVRDILPQVAEAVESQMLRVLETGEPRLNVEFASETPAHPGVARHWVEQWLPIVDLAGRVTGLNIVVEETTARTLAARAVEENRFLQTVIEHIPVSVCFIGGDDLRLRLVNPSYQAIAPGKALVGKTLEEGWPETGRDFSALCRRVLETGEPHHGVDEAFTIRRSEEGPLEEAYFTWSLHRVRLPGGQGWGILNTAWETTNRRRTEEALRTSEARLQIAQASAGAGVWEWDLRSGQLTWSDQLFSLFGLDPAADDASFETWRRRLDPEDRELAERRIEAAVAAHTPLASEYRIILPTGEIRWILALGNTAYSEAGTPVQMTGICLDVTARKQAEARIREAEEARRAAEAAEAERRRFLDVLDTLPAMICLLTPDHQVVFANRGFRRAFGEAGGRPCFEYCFGRSAPCEFCQGYPVEGKGERRHGELDTPDGKTIAVYSLPFTDADGSTLILEMDLDITEQRRAEQALEDAHGALTERAAQLRALAGALTLSEQRERRRLARILHDHVQQLLVAAKVRVSILGRSGDASTQSAAAEIEDLLIQTLSSARQLTAEISPPVLHQSGLPGGLGWLARWMGDKHGLTVELSVVEDLPRLAEDASVLLFESVRELLFNVVKHAPGAAATVRVRRTEEDEIQVVVSDDGPGFAHDVAGLAGDGVGGYGFFSIRERLALLGGRLDIESPTGQGSRVSLTAPLVRLVEPPPPRVEPERRMGPPAAAPVEPKGTGRRIRVLIADDHALIRQGLHELIGAEPDLEVVGYALDGIEAVREARRLRPDVVVMDVQMPMLDGVEATAVIHRDLPEIRVIGLSMFDAAESAQTMRDAGAAAYVSKSAPSDQLLAAIRRAVQRRDPV